MKDILKRIRQIKKDWCCVLDTLNCMFPDPLTIKLSGRDTICEDTQSTLTATVSGGKNTYQWQQLGEGWSNIVGATSLTYVTDFLPEGTYSYRLVVTQCNNHVVYSDVIEVNAIVSSMLVYDSADDNEICDGGIGVLHVEIIGGAAPFHVQLQNYVGGSCPSPLDCTGGTWVDVVGQSADGSAVEVGLVSYYTDVLTGIENQSHFFRFVVTDSNGCVGYSNIQYSGEDILYYTQDIQTVASPLVYISAEDDVICDGGTTILHSEIIGGAGISLYQWQTFVDEAWVDIVGANGPDLITETLSEGEYAYQLIVTQDSGCYTVSEPVLISVVADPTVEIFASTYVCEGSDFYITSVVSGGEGPTTYQWQKYDNSPGDGWVNSEIAEYDADLSWIDAENGSLPVGEHIFRLQIYQDSGCEATSEPITITIIEPISSIVLTAEGDTFCNGVGPTSTIVLNADVTSIPVGATAHYTWQVNPAANPGWRSFYISPATSTVPTFTVTGNAYGFELGSNDIRVIVSIDGVGACGVNTSNSVTITINNC